MRPRTYQRSITATTSSLKETFIKHIIQVYIKSMNAWNYGFVVRIICLSKSFIVCVPPHQQFRYICHTHRYSTGLSKIFDERSIFCSSNMFASGTARTEQHVFDGNTILTRKGNTQKRLRINWDSIQGLIAIQFMFYSFVDFNGVQNWLTETLVDHSIDVRLNSWQLIAIQH